MMPMPMQQPPVQQPPAQQPIPPVAKPATPVTPAADPKAQRVKPAGPQADQAKERFRSLGVAAMKIIYNKKVSGQLVEMMKAGASDPIQAVAQTAVMLIGKLRETVKGINPDGVYAVTPTVVVMLLELATAAKIFKGDPKMIPEIIAAVGRMATQKAAPAQPGAQPPPAQDAPAAPPARGLVASQMQPQQAMQPKPMMGA